LFGDIFDAKKFIERKEPKNFYERLIETEMFSTFIETLVLDRPNSQQVKQFNNPVKEPNPKQEIIKVPLPKTKGVEANKIFTYDEFPVLSSKYMVKSGKAKEVTPKYNRKVMK